MSPANTRQHRRDSNCKRHGRTLIETLVLVVLVALLVVVLIWLPTLDSHSVSPLGLCELNLHQIGISLLMYAEDYGTPPSLGFDEGSIGRIDYTVPVGGGRGTARSPSRTQPSRSGPGGATRLSTTRAMFLLIRDGYEGFPTFICPLSGDTPAAATRENFDAYDFISYANVSYGMQVPFGPTLTRIGPHMDPKMPIAADKGPYIDAAIPTPSTATLNAADADTWRAFNSPNHGGNNQSVLYADGHVSVENTPTIGVDGDNIYTIAPDNINDVSRMAGESPWARNAHPYAPVDPDGTPLASTDSVIFP